MSQSLVSNLVHLIYSTKHRVRFLHAELQPRLWAYTAGILTNWDSRAIVIGGHDDHVHLLFSLSKNHALKTVVEHVKKGSSIWLKEQDSSLSDFHWQGGYAAFSVSESKVAEVRRYIETQAEHHRTLSFQDELREFLKRHSLEFDERYLWD
jgi:REP element-mobilizing transposase RayT